MTLDSRNGIPFSVATQSTNAVAVSELATPCVVIDRKVVERNLDRLAAYARSHQLRIRPHTKTHKSRVIGQWQLDRGAGGLTVAKPSEAEVFATCCRDLLLAYTVVDDSRAARVAKLAGEIDMKVAIDSERALQVLSGAARRAGVTIGVLVDLDVGLHRTGVQSSAAAAALAQLADQLPGLHVRGIFCYPGHVWTATASQQAALAPTAEMLTETLVQWDRAGLSAEIVSGGSTPTAYQSHFVPQLTEIRPGTYPFNDMNTVRGGYAEIDDCAARVVVTVVSDATPGQVVVDAGSKTLGADRCVPSPDSGHGFVVEYPDATVTKLSEEHGQIDVSHCDQRPRVGDRLTIIPNHICPCVNLQDRAWLLADNLATPLPIDARGKLT